MNYEELLNEEQLEPVKATDGHILVLAGAGSGKTRVLTYRIAYLIENLQVRPYNILAITFTNKAANEMKERIYAATGSPDVAVSTFHSLCARILRRDIEHLEGYSKNFTIYTESDSSRLIASIIKQLGVEEKGFKEVASWHIGNAKSQGLSPEEYAKCLYNSDADRITDVYKRYETELKKANSLDFDDLLLKVIELFEKNAEVLERYQKRFRYVHIDEFQDTNRIQNRIAEMLSGYWGNLFVVGDEDQCIYTWRGAEVGNILGFKDNFADCRVFKLERNYRSTKNILDCANKVIAYNTMRMGKTLWTDTEGGSKVTYQNCYDDRAEADYILAEIMQLRRVYGYDLKDFAILIRVNSISRILEERLRLYNLSYKVYGGFKFYERKEIKDIIAYLRLISNTRDKDALLRIINFPKRGIGDTSIGKLTEWCDARGYDLFDGIKNIEEVNTLTGGAKLKLAGFRSLVMDLIEQSALLTLPEFIDYLIDSADIPSAFDKERSTEDASKLANIEELVSDIKQFAADNPGATLDTYLQSVSLISSTDVSEDDSDFLALATVHAVKGLEFKVVFVAGLEEGIFPLSRAKDEPAELEEERRIMYVAMTRAKERLYLTSAGQRYRFGKIENSPISRFIEEADILPPVFKKMKEENTPRTENAYKPDITTLGKPIILKTQDEKDLSRFYEGARIKHLRFGKGEILEMKGETAKINFPGLGVKQFNLMLAPIEIDDEEDFYEC